MIFELLEMISYKDGHINILDSVDPSEVYDASDVEVLESNLKGWGEASHVVNLDGSPYLAKEVK